MPALGQLLNGAGGGSRGGRAGGGGGSAGGGGGGGGQPADLHFWVWCSGLSATALPTAAQCAATNPSLSQADRPECWVVPNLALAALARSHGAYGGESAGSARVSVLGCP